ncbi:MAG: methylmalonyl Co-A mutase-associated GTPase MeaB [Acidimicrobiales bacterium]|nr:methylmalonyl Co-A mutase-associated GTPase MeaB [Acidimicrobiales bacterium]
MGGTTTAEELLARAAQGDRLALARLVSLVERGGGEARAVSRAAFPRAGHAYTVGIAGPPGVGKSTLTDGLIAHIRAGGGEVGVLAVDPTSPSSGGALLGDRVRMQRHATDPGVFIRSMATRGHAGGLAQAVPEAIRVLDAVGLPVVLVETIGVGQVEVEVAGAADTTMVVVNPGSGDSVQANKAGLYEVADLFVVNKADRPGVEETRRDLELMLDLSALGRWRPPILATVASSGQGVEEVWAEVGRHRALLEERSGTSSLLDERRRARLEEELRRLVARQLEQRAADLFAGLGVAEAREALAARRVDPYEAADELLDALGGR